jgi:ketosteroid isomerase-like protein
MGSENVELVRRVFVAWQEGDVDELISRVDRDVSWAPVVRFLEGERAAIGHQELRRWFRHIRITYRSFRPVPARFEEHASRVLVLGRLVAASRLAEGDLDVAAAWVWTVRAGRIVAMQAFLEVRAAREVIASRSREVER